LWNKLKKFQYHKTGKIKLKSINKQPNIYQYKHRYCSHCEWKFGMGMNFTWSISMWIQVVSLSGIGGHPCWFRFGVLQVGEFHSWCNPRVGIGWRSKNTKLYPKIGFGIITWWNGISPYRASQVLGRNLIVRKFLC
jgi:hypothetical protein